MVENMIFLDSEHAEMGGNAPPKNLLFLLNDGKTSPSGGNSPLPPKNIPGKFNFHQILFGSHKTTQQNILILK